MKADRISRFDIAVCASELHNLKFAIAVPEALSEIPEAELEAKQAELKAKQQMFIDFHLAHRPLTPVIIFELAETHNVGSPLYNNIDGSKIYHLPPECYPQLEEIVADSAFVLSQSLLKEIVDKNRLDTSIFTSLEKYWADGLLVLGWDNAIEETEI